MPILTRATALLAGLWMAALAHAQPIPAGDFHQHVFSPADIAMLGPGAGLRQVFAAANRHHMAIVVHMRANLRNHRPYGAEQARSSRCCRPRPT